LTVVFNVAHRFEEAGKLPELLSKGAEMPKRLFWHWVVALNANNLFDKKYYQTVGTSTYCNYYGDPRNFMLTVRTTY